MSIKLTFIGFSEQVEFYDGDIDVKFEEDTPNCDFNCVRGQFTYTWSIPSSARKRWYAAKQEATVVQYEDMEDNSL